MLTRPLRAALVALALVAAACGSQPAATPAPADTSSPTAEPTTSPTAGPISVDLSPGGEATALDNGWTVRHCDGDAPLLCVSDEDGNILGAIEFGSYPATDAIAQGLAEGDVVPALEQMAADQHGAIAADRAVGCGEDYEYRPEPVRESTVGDDPAVTYAFSGFVGDREVERHRNWYTVHGGQIRIVSTPASDPEGCMATDTFQEFTPQDLAAFEPYLERIVAGMDLPDAGTAVTEGMVVGVDGGLDGGLVYLLWGGGKQRIQQPAPMTEQDLEDRSLRREPAIAQLTVVDTPSDSSFAVVPPDGEEARLQLIVDGIVREVLIQHVAAEVLEGTPDLDESVLDRIRPARSAAG